jgi:hypothetical protein
MAQAFLAIGAVISAVGTIKQMKQAKKAEKLEKKRAKGAIRQGEVEAESARRRSVRQSMIAAGTVTAQGAGQGFGLQGTSGVTGSLASIASQNNTNINQINQAQGSAVAFGRINTKINEAQNSSQQWGQIGSLGMTLMTNADSLGKSANSIFKTKPA